MGIMAWRQSDYDGAEQSLGESLALYRGSGDGKGAASSLPFLGKAAIDRNELDLASELLSEGESKCRSLGDTANLADILNISAIVAMAREIWWERIRSSKRGWAWPVRRGTSAVWR